ncbi:MAG: hypothetical protein [Microviridae sp. ct0DW36]|nr:MAG: hypothetical protein [Microviridae sp. ct0DW36]
MTYDKKTTKIITGWGPNYSTLQTYTSPHGNTANISSMNTTSSCSKQPPRASTS